MISSLDHYSVTCSVLTLALCALDRYIFVVSPRRYKEGRLSLYRSVISELWTFSVFPFQESFHFCFNAISNMIIIGLNSIHITSKFPEYSEAKISLTFYMTFNFNRSLWILSGIWITSFVMSMVPQFGWGQPGLSFVTSRFSLILLLSWISNRPHSI